MNGENDTTLENSSLLRYHLGSIIAGVGFHNPYKQQGTAKPVMDLNIMRNINSFYSLGKRFLVSSKVLRGSCGTLEYFVVVESTLIYREQLHL